jgi:2'-5' RNA ligase
MRTFLAIALPEDIKESLGRLIAKLKKTGADVKWVAPDNLHLTLKFLGEIDDEKFTAVCNVIEETSQKIRRFPETGISPCYLGRYRSRRKRNP